MTVCAKPPPRYPSVELLLATQPFGVCVEYETIGGEILHHGTLISCKVASRRRELTDGEARANGSNKFNSTVRAVTGLVEAASVCEVADQLSSGHCLAVRFCASDSRLDVQG